MTSAQRTGRIEGIWKLKKQEMQYLPTWTAEKEVQLDLGHPELQPGDTGRRQATKNTGSYLSFF